MSRANKLKINVITSLILQIVVFLSGIILPRLFLEFYGSKVNGLISSIQQFLGFITLGEFGIGAVIQYNLYKPLAEKNWKNVNQIIVSANRFFNNLLKCIVIYIIILAILLPFKYIASFSFLYTSLLVIAISFSYIMQYYFGMTYRQLLDADQLSFVRIIPQIIQMLINIVVCSLLIKVGTSVQLVKLVTSILYSIQPITIFIYAKRRYPEIDTRVKLEGEPIKQKWNGIAQHFAAVVLKDTDVVVLTLFSTLENVSIYSIYNMVIYGIETLVESVVNNFTAIFGEMIAKRSYKKLNSLFYNFEVIYHMVITIIYFCIGRLIVPFVQVYTDGITDANYIVPVFALILTIAHWLYCARLPYHIVIKAAGHYKQTQNSAIIEATINVIISVAMVKIYGLIGVAVGTAAAMMYRSVYYWIYLSKNILDKKIIKTIKIYLIDFVVVAISFLLTYKISMKNVTYIGWFILAIRVFLTTFFIAIIGYSITNINIVKQYIYKRKSEV